MTLLPFDIENNCYALEINDIIEIIPLVKIEDIIYANKYLSGLINYRGQLIPIIDLKYFLFQKKSKFLLSTRIIIYCHLLQTIGIIIEDLTDTIELDSRQLISDSEKLSGSNYIKAYYVDEEKTTKIINVANIINTIYNNK